MARAAIRPGEPPPLTYNRSAQPVSECAVIQSNASGDTEGQVLSWPRRTKLSSRPVTLVEVILSKRLVLVLFFPVCLRAQGIFEIHGYVQGRFTNLEGTPDRLEIRRARLILSAILSRSCLTRFKSMS